MSEEKKNVETEVVKEEVRELTEEELEKVNGGVARKRAFAGQCLVSFGSYVTATETHGVEDEGAIPPCR